MNNTNLESERIAVPQPPSEFEQARIARELREKSQQEALDFARAKVAQIEQPGVPFDNGPSPVLADKVEQQIVPPASAEIPKPEVHNEIPGMPLKLVYSSEKERAEVATNLISSPPDTTKEGVANQLQAQMEQLVAEAKPTEHIELPKAA